MKQNLALEQALALVDNCPEPVLLLDAEDRVVAANAALRGLIDDPEATLIGRSSDDLAGTPLQLLLVGTDTFSFLGNRDRHCYFTAVDVRLPPGARAVRARILRDVTEIEHLRVEQERLQSELREQALHDRVTGLLNRRGLMVALEPQVSRCRRYPSPLSVIVMDVYGDNTDDAFLKQVSHILKDQLRWADIIACSDAHEFIIALPETQREDALRLTEKLDERLAHDFAGHTSTWAAYGVVEWQKTDNAGTLLRRAQSALDQARAARSGRTAIAL